MSSKLIALLLLACLAMVHAVEQYQEDEKEETAQKDETMEKAEETTNDESKMIVEDMDTETSTALAQNDDPDSIKNKGLCHWDIKVWYKPGAAVRCNCMKCLCKRGGNWACGYEFSYCPYYYCGNVLYNPATQLCCCGKVHSKRRGHACCGYFYYDTRVSQCCNYYSVKPRKAKCPRFRV